MDLKLTLLTGLMVASLPQLASAQTSFVAECAAPMQGVSVNSGLVTLQSQVVSTRTIPVAARLLSSRVVATGWAPTSPVNSLSTFGTASVPLATSFVRNSAATVQPFSSFGQPVTTFGVQSTVGFPTTFAGPTTFTLTPQTVTNAPFAVSPAVANVLGTRIASENCRSSTAQLQSASTSCCSAKSLQSLSSRLEALDVKLACLEKSLGGSTGGGQSKDDIDGLLGDDGADKDDQPNSSSDPIDELLGDAVD